MANKLLLVEDDAATLEVMSSFLQRRKFRVVSCSRVVSAMDIFEKDPEIGLVVTDLRMAGADGFDMLRCISDRSRKTGEAVPVIVVTGHGTPEDENRSLALGAAFFLRKPIDLHNLLAAIGGYPDILPGHSDGRNS